MRWPIIATLGLLSASVSAHPGTGLVKDQAGNIFYTDLSNIWKIDSSGRRSLVVRGVHTHELALDLNGQLVGEDVKYLGNDRYRHRVRRLELNGTVSNALPWRTGFWRDYGLVHNTESEWLTLLAIGVRLQYG